MSIANLNKLDNFSVFSFDIFDTLLLRPYIEPQDLWKIIEKEENAAGFAADRKKADAITYHKAIKRGCETSIEEAYQLIPQWSHLKTKELDKERDILSPNPEIVNLWNELGNQGKRRILISDMYLPKDFLESVLRQKGIDGWDAFYLSSDKHVRKASGALFRLMLKDEGINPSEICHIGDNKYSDIEVPASLGIKTIHYQKISERFFDICPFARNSEHKLVGSISLGWHIFKCSHKHVTYWHRLGYVLGGVLGYLYVSWIVETARRVGINHLMFVGRDGYALQKICNALYPDIRTDYFYAPRIMSIATLGATGNDPNAIRDRQEYMEGHLQGIDKEIVRKEYLEYLQQFSFDKHTAIVDGCSSGFSAQRMVEDVLGHRVFTFYLMTMASMHYGACLYYRESKPLPFQCLSEFIFSAPHPPVIWVTKDEVLYADDIDSNEQTKINVSEDITQGIIACSIRLHKDKIRINTHEWIKYCDDFMLNLTPNDKVELSKARNACDVQQKVFRPITFTSMQKEFVTKRLFGYPLLSFRYKFKNGWLQYKRYLFGRWLFSKNTSRWYDENLIVM